MKKILILASAVLLAVGFASSAWAACGALDDRTFGQLTYSCGGYFCYVVGPNPAPTEGDFWAYGSGDPVLGSGNDNGTFQPDEPASDGAQQWCRVYGSACYMSGTWASTFDIDGCITGSSDPEIQIVAFSDFDGTDAWWVAAAKERTAGKSEFDFALLATDLDMITLPAVSITNTQRDPDGTSDFNTVEISVAAPDMSAGCYTDGSLACGDFVGFQVFKQVVARAAGTPTDRTTAAWTAAAAAGVTTFRETCATDSDIYLAIAAAYDSGFTSDWVGVATAPINCGPTIADPEKPGRQFRIIDRKPGKGQKVK